MPAIEIAAERIFFFKWLPVTNSLLMSWIVIGILLSVGWLISKRIKEVPSILQNIIVKI